MKAGLYLVLLLGVVPLQTTVLDFGSGWLPRPDLCLAAACLVGVYAGELEGLLFGLAIGFVQDLFSAGPAWVNLGAKGAIGLLAGVSVRHIAHATPWTVLGLGAGLSFMGSLGFLFGGKGASVLETLLDRGVPVVSQAAVDAAVVAALYWVLQERLRSARTLADERPGYWH